MEYLLLAVNIAFGTGKKVLHGIISKKYLHNMADYYAGNGVIFLVMTVCLLPFALATPFPSPLALLLSVLNGVGNVLFQVFSSRAMNAGPVSLTVLITCFSLVPPILFSVVFMGDTVVLMQLVGFVLLALTFFLTVKPDKGGRVNLRWLVLTVTAFLISSACGIVGKLRVIWVPQDSVYWFLVIGNFCATLLAFVMTRSAVSRQSIHISFRWRSAASLMMCICGVLLSVNNVCSAVCNELIPGTILFPTQNGSMMVLTMAISAIILREKLTRRQLLGVGTGVVSLLLICKAINI